MDAPDGESLASIVHTTDPEKMGPLAANGGYAGLAQLVEHLICNQGVGGSSPSAGTTFLNRNQ